MPYIKQSDREKFNDDIINLAKKIELDGELNYFVTALVHNLLMRRGVNYQNMQNLDGCLGQIQAEFRRTIIGPYEDIKIGDNGHVSVLDLKLADGAVPDKQQY